MTQNLEERLARDKKELCAVLHRVDWSGDVDPLGLPVSFWGNTAIDFMNPAERDVMLSSMFRYSLRRALKVMPLYERAGAYAHFDPGSIQSLNDVVTLPLLVKDGNDEKGVVGFRESVQREPLILMPKDVSSAFAFKSGGTKGLATPTFMTKTDLEIEAQSLGKRSFLAGGLEQGDVLYNCYNPAHKGGQLIALAANLVGVKMVITRRPEDDVSQCVRDMKAYGCTAIAAVQPPVTDAQSDAVKKGDGATFLNLYREGRSLFGKQIKTAFVTGYGLPGELIELAKRCGFALFTAWGASEAIVGATSTVVGPKSRKCEYNQQHLVFGPHYLGLAKRVGAHLEPIERGEDGLLLLSTIAREGTLYFNYAIGDKATYIGSDCACARTTPVVANIRRVDNPREIAGVGCRND